MSQRTVMVCEDEYFIRTDISDHLRDEGYRVLEAKDADCAQSTFLAGEHIDLLSTDVMMPGTMDGLDLAKWVRKTFPEVLIMVVTGWPKHEGAGRNFDAFMMKPYLVDEVVGRIKELVPLSH